MPAETQELPSLYHNVNLRSLEIDGLVVPGCVAWTSALLSDLRASQLETLSVSMLVLNTASVSTFDWADLNSALSRPAFAHTTLVVNISLALHSSNDPRVVKEAVVGLLPDVVKRGKLSLRCT